MAASCLISSSNTGRSKFPSGDEWNTDLNEANDLEGSATFYEKKDNDIIQK